VRKAGEDFGVFGGVGGVALHIQKQGYSVLDFARSAEVYVRSFAQAQLIGLGSSRRFTRDRPVSVATLFESAIENMLCNFAFIGIMERFDESLSYLRDGFGMIIDHRRIEPLAPVRKQTLSDDERGELTKILEAEIELYRLANQLLDHRLGAVSKTR
jgi:hypothetical protein